MVAGMTMSGYQPADVSASQESEYIIVTKDKKSMKTVESKYNTMIDTQEQNTDFLKDENVLVSKMTAKEADIVNKDQKVVSVEKNTMVNASETESTTAAKEDQGTDSQWNLKSIHVDKAKDTATDEKVKVALLDSGIDEANAKGILVIAAAGNQGENGTDNVEYPAAFENVVAVGSVDSKAEVSDFSSTGKEVDVVAPGEAVRATGAFGETMVTSGTSMAVPHVVGAASLLWQKDTSKSKDFIKNLLEESARNVGDKESYGNGLIDYEYAEKQYTKAEEQYEQGQDIELKDNTKTIKTYNNSSDENKVSGTWSAKGHQEYLTENNVNIPAMKDGAVYPDKDDSGVPGMTENPDFHGLYERRHSGNEEVNYLASYRFMIKIGNEYGKGKTYTSVSKADIPGLTDTSYSRIRSMMANLQKKSFFKNYSNANKKAFVFGVAMHTSTDTFAHSTYRYYNGTWYSITHAINEKKGQYKKNEADNSKFVPERFDMAYRAERNTLYRYQGKRSDVAVCHDFHAANDPDKYYPSNPAFKVKRISKYGTQVHLSDANVIAHFATINYN